MLQEVNLVGVQWVNLVRLARQSIGHPTRQWHPIPRKAQGVVPGIAPIWDTAEVVVVVVMMDAIVDV